MIFILFVLLLVVWAAVLYLSLNKEEKKQEKKINWKETDFWKEFWLVQIQHPKFLEVYNKASEYIIWADNLLKSIIVSLLADGHILVEWMPGLAKTRTILVYSKLMDLDFKRIQFTPDMLPSDVIWGEIFDKKTGEFKTFLGPIFTNLLLADEINRATPKVQSALLEAMQERKVTIAGKTYELPRPFFVMATQNPIEQEWTFPLPEAQMDRFLMKIIVDYPSKEAEKQILDTYSKNIDDIESILSKEELLEYQKEVEEILVPENVKQAIVDIVEKLRHQDENILFGPSPRASISLLKVAKVIAFLKGKQQVDFADVKPALLPVLRHRIKPSMKALIEKEPIENIIIEKIKD